MMINNEYHGKLMPSQVSDILESYRVGELALTKEQQQLTPLAQRPTPQQQR